VSTGLVPLIATLCGALFAGAAAYVSLVEHPARLSCGPEIAVREFRPSYHRGAIMQATLAVIGTIAGFAAWAMGQGPLWAVGAAFLGSAVPFTLIAILPTNKRLLDPALEPSSSEAATLLSRWGALHAVRTLVGLVALILFVVAPMLG
jgi:uncharacterized membrane protein